MSVTPEPAVRRRARRRRRLIALLIGGVLLVPSIGATALTFALYTDQETVGAAFTTGTIVLDDAKVDALDLTTSALMPGQAVTGAVSIENDGTADLRYSMTSSSTNADAKDLRGTLTLVIKSIDATTPGTPCDDFDGTTTLFSGIVGASSAAIGDATAGDDVGDRSLTAGSAETLCFRVSLPSSAGNGTQGSATTTTFTFNAEQVIANP